MVIGKGKNQFREQYQYLEVPESKWFTKNIETFLQGSVNTGLEFSCTACHKPLPWLKTLRALHNRFISPSNALKRY